MKSLKEEYDLGRRKMGNDYDFYNLVEKQIIEAETKDNENRFILEFDTKTRLVKEIKGLAMCLSRFKPADWNKFLDVVIK